MDDVAAARVPWIGAQWDLIDLQIEQRGGRLISSLTTDNTLRLRRGDAFRLAVLFFDGSQAVNPSPTRLRWMLRSADNRELVAAVTLQNPQAQTDQSQPYFLLQPDIAALGGVAADLLDEARGFLPCVMDVDWTIAGRVYSSQTLSAVVEFGLGSEKSAAPVISDTPGEVIPFPTTPSSPGQPPQPPQPPPMDPSSLRALFDQWLLETLPVESGFLYVRNGQIVAAVPGGDCTTGQLWTPTT